ncbi:MAG: PAS domain S-box protein [Zavarzinella sp.]|nr:PAS domain S-box protein [Zavarzinella sp.]
MASSPCVSRLAASVVLAVWDVAPAGAAEAEGWSTTFVGSGAAGALLALLGAAVLVLALRRRLGRQALSLRDHARRERELEAEYRDLMENANDVFFTLDRSNRITSFNRAGERLTGFSRDEVVGRALAELADPDTDPATLAQSTTGSKAFEIAIRTRDGRAAIWEVTARPAKRNGTLAALNCIARDVTQRKRAHDELRRLYLIRDQQFEHSPLAFIEWDAQFRVVRWSEQAERTFGWTAEEAIGKTYTDLGLAHEEDVETVRAAVADLEAGQGTSSCAVRNYTKDRAIVHVEWYDSALRDAGGRIQCVLSLAQDVTARKRAEEERARLEEQVRQAQKMEAVGRLAGGIAHDFNNLLTVINGCSDLLLAEARPGDSAHGLADEIRRAGEQAASLTRQLLAFGRRQITAPTALDLNGVVRDVEKILRRLIGEHIELATDLEPAGARVKADPGLMLQLLMNLAVNARDAMPQGGRLTIQTQVIRNRVRLVVTDTGVGMDARTQAHIFEPFFTTKPAGEGTGIGLATVHGIVEQSGGTITVESTLGHGTTFRIELPVCAEKVPAAPAAPAPEPGRGPKGTVLLVEDEDLVRSLATRVLEARGYRVFAAPSAADALDLHARTADPVDLVVTDVVMPGLGGRQLAERLRERQPGLRVLFMSGYTTDEVLRQGIQEEEEHFIQKPFTPDSLARKVRDVLVGPVEAGQTQTA